jgi:hypothetical protein
MRTLQRHSILRGARPHRANGRAGTWRRVLTQRDNLISPLTLACQPPVRCFRSTNSRHRLPIARPPLVADLLRDGSKEAPAPVVLGHAPSCHAAKSSQPPAQGVHDNGSRRRVWAPLAERGRHWACRGAAGSLWAPFFSSRCQAPFGAAFEDRGLPGVCCVRVGRGMRGRTQ